MLRPPLSPLPRREGNAGGDDAGGGGDDGGASPTPPTPLTLPTPPTPPTPLPPPTPPTPLPSLPSSSCVIAARSLTIDASAAIPQLKGPNKAARLPAAPGPSGCVGGVH